MSAANGRYKSPMSKSVEHYIDYVIWTIVRPLHGYEVHVAEHLWPRANLDAFHAPQAGML